MLCDEPGLGKTISTLAVIVKTLGMFPAAPCFEDSSACAQSLTEEREGEGVGGSERRLRKSIGVSRSRTVHSSSLIESGATLVIIPDVLMDHWKLQVTPGHTI